MDFAVRSNLWQFLEAARTQLGHQILWIDALCINQSLTSERNHQVQQMGHIYNKALGVIVWLSGYSSALIFLQDNHLNPQRYTENCFSVGGKVSNATLTELLDLCEDEYWYRTWVIQEILLAKELHIMSQCGKFSWHALSYFLLRNKSTLDMEHSLPLRHATDHRTVLTKSRASILCRERQSTPGRMHACHLTDLVVKFGKSRCGDVRDRVLGLLGLADLGANKEFRVDYAMNVEALFHYMVESNYFRTSDRQEVYALASILELDFRIQSLLVLRPVMTFFKPEGKTKALFPTDLSLSDQTVSRASYQCHFCRADLVIYRDHFISQEPDWHALSTGRSGWKFDNAYFEPGWWPGLDPSDKVSAQCHVVTAGLNHCAAYSTP